jgi:PAS domain S-box-containing protein
MSSRLASNRIVSALPSEVPLSAGERVELFARQTDELYRLLLPAAAFSFLGAILTFVLLYTTGDAQAGVYWFAFATGVFLLRLFTYWEYHNPNATNRRHATWANLAILGNFLAGIQWGLLGTWLYVPEPLYRALFTVIVIASYVGGAAISFSAVRFAHAALAVPAVLPATIYVFFLRDDGNIIAGAISLFMMVAVIYFAHLQYGFIRSRLVLQMQADTRLKQAADENSTLGLSMRELERRNEVVKRAQVEARRRAQTLATHVQQTLLPIIEIDQRGRVIEWNDAAVATFGYTQSDLENRSVDEILLPQEKQRSWSAFLVTTLLNKAPDTLEVWVDAKDGRKVAAKLYVTPIDIDDSKATRAAIIVTGAAIGVSVQRIDQEVA